MSVERMSKFEFLNLSVEGGVNLSLIIYSRVTFGLFP